MKKPIAKLEQVTLEYKIQGIRTQRSIKELLSLKSGGEGNHKGTYRALENINLEFYWGDNVGVIGENGAGKSTLLKILGRIILPSKGRIRLWADPIPLLGIGTGFNPDLSGRDNVYIYSSFLGKKKNAIDRVMDDIIAFAELEKFIDQPISSYSKGMVARLGFSTIMADEPKLLMVDEILGVGDDYFKEKCREVFLDLRGKNATLIIVSHSLPFLNSFCNRVVWIKDKHIFMDGDPEEVTDAYKKYMQDKRAKKLAKWN
ncbi:MAG: ATP-binding cassette domain-containing protein [Chloroflexota bacterium]